MASERLDYDDAYTTRFSACVAAAGRFGGRPAVELERTYFYPESGGQQADRGTLGDVAVVDVQVEEPGRVWHVLEREADVEGAAAEVDWPRRFDHMQQHTGQHVLSAAFERVLDAPTLSSTLGAERCVIEVGLPAVDWRAVERVERAANAVLWEDRPIQRHWVDDEGVRRFALRKPPAVSGRIRIVEVPDWDVSACGGTHVRRTGEVGVVKVLGWEKVRGNVRFAFACGSRALADHAWRTESLTEAARRRTLADRELIAHLERAAEERDQLRATLERQTAAALEAEARGAVGDPPRPYATLADDRSRDAVRRLALAALAAGAPWAVAATRGPEPALVMGRARGPGADLRTLLPELLARSGGRGGGSPELLQMGGADAASLESAHAWAVEWFRAGDSGERHAG